MRSLAVLLLLSAACLSAAAQTQPEEYRVYTEHPRLFLRPQRLRLLKRERERQSMRWRQFEALVSGHAPMPEPGFALGLYYAVSGDAAAGRRAVEWALGPGSDLRQLALVYDWCQPLLAESQSKALSAKIQKALALPPSPKIASQRNRVLAAIALAERDQNASEAMLREAVVTWWNVSMLSKLNGGANLDPGADLLALLEILHAVRDNLTIDLRSGIPDYFKNLPAYEVLCNYPAAFAATENEYRIPFYTAAGDPDLNRAALSRAAGLSTVAFDTNALENQFLQGWLIQDRFMLRGVFGAPYEFLWANPYQPGLSYARLPLTFHDERSGALFLRSSWDEDAVWFGLNAGQAQLYRDGHITVLALRGQPAAKPAPVHVGAASVLAARNRMRFQADGDPVFIVGWKPRAKYDVEVDGEEMTELQTDAAGTLTLRFAGDREPGVRIRETGGFAVH